MPLVLLGPPLNRIHPSLAWLPSGSTSAVFARASSAGLAFLATVAWARALDPTTFGAYSLAMSTLMIVAAVALLGLDQLTSRELGVLLHKEDWPHVWGFLCWGARQAAIASLVGALIAGTILWWNPMGWPGEGQVASLWILIGVPAVVFLRASRGGLQATDRTATGLFWELTFWNALLVIVGAAFWLSRTPVDGSTAALVHAGTAVVASALAIATLLCSPWQRQPATREHHSAWMRAGLGFALFSAVGLLMQQADILLLGAIGTQEEIGLYSIASRSALLVLIVLGPINQVLSPRLAKAWSRNDPDAAAAIARRAAQLGLVAGAGLVLFYFVFGHFFLGLFGPEYVSAAPALRILAVAQIALLLLGPGAMALAMTGAEKRAAWLNGLGLLAGLPLAYLLYHTHGIEGMAWGRLATLAVAGASTGIMGCRRLGRRIDPWTS